MRKISLALSLLLFLCPLAESNAQRKTNKKTAVKTAAKTQRANSSETTVHMQSFKVYNVPLSQNKIVLLQALQKLL